MAYFNGGLVDPLTPANVGFDMDGDILYTSDRRPVVVDLQKEWCSGYDAGQQVILKILKAYLEAPIDVKNQIQVLLKL